MHLRGLEAMGATFEIAHGYVEAQADRLHGADVHVRVPQRRSHREHPDRGGAREGHDGHRQRRPRARDRRPVLDAGVDGCRHRGHRFVDARRARRRAGIVARHRSPNRAPTASRRPPTWQPSAVSGGELFLQGARADHMENLLRRFTDMGLEIVPQHDGLTVRATERLRSIDVATLPYPGIATDYKPLIVTMLVGRRRCRHRHREPVPRSVPLRRGAATTRCRHPHRRPPRRRARPPVAQRCTGEGARHPRRRRAGGGRSGRRRAPPSISGVHHIDRGYDDLVGRLAAVGASIERR